MHLYWNKTGVSPTSSFCSPLLKNSHNFPAYCTNKISTVLSSLPSIKWLFAKIKMLQKHRGPDPSWNPSHKKHTTNFRKQNTSNFRSKHSAEIYPDLPRRSSRVCNHEEGGKLQFLHAHTWKKKTLTATKTGLDCTRVALPFSGRSVAKTSGRTQWTFSSQSAKNQRSLKILGRKMFFVKCHWGTDKTVDVVEETTRRRTAFSEWELSNFV